MIDQHTIQRIVETADIVEVISEFVPLKKAGASFKGLCPFHDDTTPSLVVNPARGSYKCYACGEGGDVVDFLMKHNGWEFLETIKWLAAKYGIAIEEHRPNIDKETEKMFRAVEWAATHFENNLTQDAGRAGREYFLARGFTEETIKTFRLGYALPDRFSFPHAAYDQYISKQTLLDTGLANKPDDAEYAYARFADRVIFPWINASGRVVAFGGRKLDAATKGMEQKYINSCESPIFHKSAELYGIYQAKAAIRTRLHAYIVEGYTDVITFHQAGVKNVVSCSGTALSPTQAHLLRRFCTDVTLVFDGDTAGLTASAHNIKPFLAEGMNVKVIVLPDGEDPDTIARHPGLLAKDPNRTDCTDENPLQAYLATAALDFLDFYTTHIIDKEPTIPARSSAISTLLQTIATIPNEVTKSLYLAEVQRRYALTSDAIPQALGTETLTARIERLEAEVEELKGEKFTKETV